MSKKTSQSQSVFSPQVIELPNKIKLVCDYVPTVESCALGIWVKAGTRDEPRGLAGVAHFVEHTSFRRTRNRSTRQIARDFENVGAYANAYTTKEETCYYVRTLSEHVPKVLDTLADVVVAPLFHSTDIEKERGIITEEIRAYEDEAEELIFDEGELQLFGKHPLGLPIVGTASTVAKISSADVRSFHSKHYHAGSVVATISGNFDIDNLIDEVASGLKSVGKKRSVRKRTTPVTVHSTERIIHKSVQQGHLLWHRATPGFDSKDRSALMLLNVILGDGMTSRLHLRFRDTKGIAYNVYSQLQLFADIGMFSVYAGVDEKRISNARKIIDTEIGLMGAKGVKLSELNRAKEQLRAGKIMSLESLTSRMTLLGKGMLDQGEPEDPFESIKQITAVSINEINRIARKLFKADDWNRCLVLPTDSKK